MGTEPFLSRSFLNYRLSGPTWRLQKHNLHLNKISRWFTSTLNLGCTELKVMWLVLKCGKAPTTILFWATAICHVWCHVLYKYLLISTTAVYCIVDVWKRERWMWARMEILRFELSCKEFKSTETSWLSPDSGWHRQSAPVEKMETIMRPTWCVVWEARVSIPLWSGFGHFIKNRGIQSTVAWTSAYV